MNQSLLNGIVCFANQVIRIRSTHQAFDFFVYLLSVVKAILGNFKLQFGLFQISKFPVLFSCFSGMLVMCCFLFQVHMSEIQIQSCSVGDNNSIKVETTLNQHYPVSTMFRRMLPVTHKNCLSFPCIFVIFHQNLVFAFFIRYRSRRFINLSVQFEFFFFQCSLLLLQSKDRRLSKCYDVGLNITLQGFSTRADTLLTYWLLLHIYRSKR